MRILEIRPVSDNGHPRPLRAFADIELPDGTIIRDFRIIEEPGKRPFVATPQASWRDPETGRICFKTLISFPEPVKARIDIMVLGAWLEAEEKTLDHSDDRR